MVVGEMRHASGGLCVLRDTLRVIGRELQNRLVDSRHKGPIARHRTFETSSALVAELLRMGVGSAGGV